MDYLEEKRSQKLLEFYEFEIQNQKKKKKILGEPEFISNSWGVLDAKIFNVTVWFSRVLPFGIYFWVGTLHQFERENYDIGFICVGLIITGFIKDAVDKKYYEKFDKFHKPWSAIDGRIADLEEKIKDDDKSVFRRYNQKTEYPPHKYTSKVVITSKTEKETFNFQLTHPFFLFLKGQYKNNLADGKWTIQTNWIDEYAMFQDEINCYFNNGILDGECEINYLCHKEDFKWMKALNPVGIRYGNFKNKLPEQRIFTTMNLYGMSWDKIQCTKIIEFFIDGKLHGVRKGFDDKNIKLFEELYNENTLVEVRMDALSDRWRFAAPKISTEIMSIIEYEGKKL